MQREAYTGMVFTWYMSWGHGAVLHGLSTCVKFLVMVWLH